MPFRKKDSVLCLTVYLALSCVREPCGPFEIGDELNLVIGERVPAEELRFSNSRYQDNSCTAALFDEGTRMSLDLIGEYELPHRSCMTLEAKVTSPPLDFEVTGGEPHVFQPSELRTWTRITDNVAGVVGQCWGVIALSFGQIDSGSMEGQWMVAATFHPQYYNRAPGAANPYCEQLMGFVPESDTEIHSCSAFFLVTLE
jgi:hypothetical protein